MSIHKRTRLTLLDRQAIWQRYQTRRWKVIRMTTQGGGFQIGGHHFHILHFAL